MQIVPSTPDDAQQKLALLMEEQRDLHVIHEQRLTQVETRISVVEVKLPRVEAALEKLTDIVAVQVTQSTLNEAAITAIRERTDQFADHMEKATDRLMDKQDADGIAVSKLETRMGKQETKMGAVQAVGLTAVGIVLTMLAQHFIPFPK